MDVADIEIGMEAEIKFEAYSYNKYGTVKGTVKYISPSSFNSEQWVAFTLQNQMLITQSQYQCYVRSFRQCRGENRKAISHEVLIVKSLKEKYLHETHISHLIKRLTLCVIYTIDIVCDFDDD